MNDQPDSQPEQPDESENRPQYVMGPHGIMTIEAYQRMADQQHAHFESSAHQGVQFWESLTEDQLLTFRGMLNALAADESVAPYYQGMTSAYLRWRFNICPACALKHDEELHKIIEHEGKSQMHDVDGQTETDEEELQENARIWNVVFDPTVVDGRPLHLTPVICAANCGASWPNLADRMLRKPGGEGCPGCIQKMKTG